MHCSFHGDWHCCAISGAPFHHLMSGKSGGHSNMMLFWRQRWQAAMPWQANEGVIRRLSTMCIYSLTVRGLLASFCGIDFKGVDNMLEQLEKPSVAPDDSQTMSENVFRRIQAAIVKGEIAPAARFPSRSWRAPTASVAARCAKRSIAWKASACWCGCLMSAHAWCL